MGRDWDLLSSGCEAILVGWFGCFGGNVFKDVSDASLDAEARFIPGE